MSRLGEILTDPTPLDPPGRPRAGRVELQPARDRAQRRADPPRPRPRRPVHRRPRAVPHRHRPLRRHRAAGDDADRGRRRRAAVGSPLDGLERGGDRAARRVRAEHRAVPPARRRDGLHRAGAVRRRRDAAARRRSPTVDLDELRAVGWVRVPYPDDGRPFGDGQFPTPSGKVELVSDALAAMGQPALPTFVPPREGPGGDPELLARYPAAAADPEAPHPLPQLRLLAPAQARSGRGWAVRRARRRRRRRPAASPTATWPGSATTGRRSSVPVRSPTGSARASSPSRSAGGAPSTPTAGSPTPSPTTRSPTGAAASPSATRSSRS